MKTAISILTFAFMVAAVVLIINSVRECGVGETSSGYYQLVCDGR